jgi:RNA polymerase subunit RPABC4/transcription elongation factor Spt4
VSEVPEEEGGDPVCWAHLACPECGAMPEEPDAETCPRCGTPLEAEA